MSEGPRSRIAAVLARFVPDAGELAAALRNEPLRTATSLDSLKTARLALALEREFGVRFRLETLADTLRDVEAIEAFIREATAGRAT